MSICFWSVKGGSGCSTVAAAVALSLARSQGDALLVDMTGEQPAVLGAVEPSGPGLAEWLAAGRNVPPDALGRLEVQVTPALRLLPTGQPLPLRCSRDRAELLARLLGEQGRPVVIDAGALDTAAEDSEDGSCCPAAVLASRARASLLVLRPCYLALRRATAGELRPSGAVLVNETERALDAGDVARVLGVPVVGEIRSDPAVARAIDSGLLVTRTPRALVRGAGEVLANGS